MNKLLNDILDVHGLNRWHGFKQVQATLLSGGGLFAFKGMPGDAERRRMTVWTQDERAELGNFGAPDLRMAFTPRHAAIVKCDGTIVQERANPRDAFADHQMATAWNPLDLAYFNGEALWTYFMTPFLLALPRVVVEERDTWSENGEPWRVLRAHFPNDIATHSATQDFFFGDDLLLRRHDYNVDLAGGFSAAQLVFDYVEVQGIRLPTKRRAYTRSPSSQPILDMLMVFIDISDIEFS